MKKTLLATLIASSLVVMTGCSEDEKETVSSETEATTEAAPAESENFDSEKFSYSVGYMSGGAMRENIGDNINDIDVDAYIKGIREGISGEESKLSEQDMEAQMIGYQMELQARQAQESAAALEKAKAFLAENAEKEGIIVLEEGLQYRVLETAEGEKPVAEDTIVAHYEGRLTDGSIFDSSYERGEPATFPLRGVIPGWTKALQEMPVGSKWELFISPELAYGEMGAGEIGPNEPLIFVVELLEIKSDDSAE